MITAEDRHWLQYADDLAGQASQQGEVAVGSVILSPQGTLLAEAQESVVRENDPTAHAEAQAIRSACQQIGHRDLTGCTLYTTTEPCFLCSYVIRVTGITRVIIGKPVSGIGGVTSDFPLLTTTDIPDFALPPGVEWQP